MFKLEASKFIVNGQKLEIYPVKDEEGAIAFSVDGVHEKVVLNEKLPSWFKPIMLKLQERGLVMSMDDRVLVKAAFREAIAYIQAGH